ncbi:deoxyribodipyrimidine photolyase-related protein [Spirosomataceae bacterium TFI 002]|nr:deoxyribodipyrimidine photolyase-related protein [Spirosomataceae bacterium TFI 002]
MTLRLILGDQLNHNHSWFQEKDDNVFYLMMEVRQETDYVKHHIQKVIAFFLAMRNFANELEQSGHKVKYIHLDNTDNQQDISKNILAIAEELGATKFQYLLPDEYRLDVQLKAFEEKVNHGDFENLKTAEHFDTEHFYTKRGDLESFFKGKKTYLMENFYRMMRKKHNLLMNGEEPQGDQWNFDADNRKKLPKDHTPTPPFIFHKNVKEIVKLIKDEGVQTIGTVEEDNFIWPISRDESLQLLDFFLDQCLPLFGTYEDAMSKNSWSIYHSRLSFAMNAKLLSPEEVIKAAIEQWKKNQNTITLSQIEGFVRQILGWREFMRGIYWAKMPEFASLNYFENKRQLPEWFWTGETRMNCLKHSIGQSLDKAYAHHIQRLMIIGNFALLAGIDPNELDEWYLGIYIDAIEWVEITNTRGMSQYADGGIVGSKPYAGSANYINKMSDYCGSCHYKYKEKTGDKACPFNSLYWQFHERNREKLAKNPRIGMVYRLLDKMETPQKKEIMNQAQTYIENIATL